ncbi:BA75_01297T0 [Komagataella pastoris]|uniref:DNA topoisomerase n=1 Tax=Komagataella pastoris TaxID=4922 RepID=A0A1B2J659_PICPA|nr:BA75_01297T0 [Komagataella pastoris]
MKILCVAEKPSIAKSVAYTLGGGKVTVRNSSVKYVKNYDFTFEFPGMGRCSVTMTSVLGHLTEMTIDNNRYGWGKCLPINLFDSTIIVKENGNDSKKLMQNIANEARLSNQLMIWTDCDREGEHIGWEILNAASKTNPSLKLENVWRAQFSHLERSHIISAAKNPKQLDRYAIDAVCTRMELDLRAGFSFTRFLTDLFKTNFHEIKEERRLISYGGCQFPTLGFVVDRYMRVKEFVPEEFWYISIEVKKGNRKLPMSWSRPHLFDRLAAMLLYENSLDMAKDEAEIVHIISKPTSNFKPLPLTTVQLQKDCSKFFKLSAKETLDAAEKLYNQGFISYPRTETDRFDPKTDLKNLLSKQLESPQWGGYVQELLDGKLRSPRAGKHDDKAHPPIHPICYTDFTKLKSRNEQLVYQYVTKRFLACCSDDAKGVKSVVTAKWGLETFTASGLMVLESNYLNIYDYFRWTSTKELPEFTLGEKVKLLKADLVTGKTSPPTYMSEAELIALMDINGIGTDATIAEHIEKILAREYASKQNLGESRSKKAYILPTELGCALVEGFNQIGFDNLSLSKPFLRKQLEESLAKITAQQETKNNVLDRFIELYRQAFVLSNQKQAILVQSYRHIQRRNA